MDVYVMKEGKRLGPFQPFRLTEMLEEGELTPQDAVWHEGMEKWQPLQDTASLQTVLRKNVPPAIPPDDSPILPAPPARPNPAAPELTLALLRQRRAIAWRRFFARQIDMILAIFLVAVSATALGWTDMWMIALPDPFFFVIAPALLWIVPEAALVSLCGTTPGRLVMGLRVVDENGRRPGFGKALLRSVLVWAGGLGFGLPVLMLLPVAQWMYASWHFQRSGSTLWDRSAGTRVAFNPLHRGHVAGIALTTALITSVFAWLWLVPPLPARLKGEERAQLEQLRRTLWESAAPARP